MKKAVFVDTWGWLALGHLKDLQHENVRKLFKRLNDEGINFHTSDYVLDELITILFRRESFEEGVRFMKGIFQGAEYGNPTIERVTSSRFSAAWGLRLKFQDKPKISFTDLTTMVIMQEIGISQILSGDEHFIQVGMGFKKVPIN